MLRFLVSKTRRNPYVQRTQGHIKKQGINRGSNAVRKIQTYKFANR